jgi:PAS domain S-box-containing protein
MTTEAQTDLRLEELTFLRSLGEVMASDLRADTALARAVDLCFVRFELGALCAFRLEDGVFRLVAAHGLGPPSRRRLERVADRDLSAMLGGLTLARDREIRTTEECTVLDDDDGADLPRSALFVPLAYARRCLGALLVIANEGEALGPRACPTWDAVASTISVSLRAADDFERVVALESEKRQLVDNLPLIVARFDVKTGGLLFVNGAVQRVLGLRPSDAMNAQGLDAALADVLERQAAQEARARASSGTHAAWEDRRYRHADGRVLTLRECVYPVFDAARSVQAVETIAYDITTEIEARKGLMQADRLAALGGLAAGIAHEINNPVAFISLAAGQVMKLVGHVERGDAEAAARLREVVAEIGESAGRIADIVGELKLFTRIGDASVSCPVDVNRILQTAIALTSSELRRHARLEVALGPLPVAPGAYVNLGHAFVNLLMNAAQAIESKLASAQGAADPAEPNLVRVLTMVQDGAIVVRVEDTGIGISEQALPRIFDPFFKCDTKGGGAGLGLAIAHDLVQRVGGEIRVESHPSFGTRFDVVLPLGFAGAGSDAPASSRSAPPRAFIPPMSPPVGGRLPRVLIIDDERALARALARQLSDRYDVETACTARDGLALLSVHAYDAIVCDLRMPDQSGPQIHEQVAVRSAEQAARFIFTTGGRYGSMDDELHERAVATGLPVLEKPFDGASFEMAVAMVVGRPGPVPGSGEAELPQA